jgi:hypothetical protein
LLTFYRFTDSGLPPQGTKKSAATSGCKWKLFLKCKPDSTISPLGSFLFSSVTSTKYPYGDNAPAKSCTILLDFAN